MPGGDRTGPLGFGPKTGRAAEAAAAGLGLILLELEKSAEKLKELLK
jgi:hypothetical protein